VRPSALAAFLALGVVAPAAPAAAAEVTWSLTSAARGPVAAGASFEVTVKAVLEDGWHIYSITQPPGGPITTSIQFPRDGRFALAGPIAGPEPIVGFDPNFNMDTEVYDGPTVTFTAPVQVADSVAPGSHPLNVNVRYQACTDRVCLPPAVARLSLGVSVGATAGSPAARDEAARPGATAGGSAPASGSRVEQPVQGTSGVEAPRAAGVPDEERPPAAPPAEEPRQSAAPAGEPQVSATPADEQPVATPGVEPPAAASRAAAPSDATSEPVTQAGGVPGGSLSAFLWLAATMGLISLLTPCVFPMVPITVSYFTNHAAKSRRGAVGQAAAYGLGIVLTFAALGTAIAIVAGAAGLNRFAANPWLNLGIAALFIAFALNLFGAFELQLPSSWLTRLDAAGRSSRLGSVAGPALMGLTFTLTSFTCTAAFIGTLLVLASQGSWLWPLVGMLVYAAVFALPFVVLALVPQLASQLPRAGGWLTTVKVSMGLLEIAAAMKFVSNVDLVWKWGIFTRELVLASWVAVALVLGFYLVGLFRLRHEPQASHPGAWRLVTGLVAFTLGVWMMTGLFGRRLGELEAFLPPATTMSAEGVLTQGSMESELSWMMNDYDGALAAARQEGKPLFVDFTGYTCTNCRWMEANMFPRPGVRRELERFVRVRLYTDGEGEVYTRQQHMQQERFGTVALPLYVIVGGDGSTVATFAGLTRNEAEFTSFLQAGSATDSALPSSRPGIPVMAREGSSLEGDR
jgi:thiol:disulfide interchange protein DsbD